MKAKGIVRRLDPLGRIVLPKAYRDNLDIAIKDDIEIEVKGTSIYVSKFEPRCILCGETESITEFNGSHICEKCRKELKSLL
jgi:transcriptional pleiotropic regulator of transition state genes